MEKVLAYYVYRYDINSSSIKPYNIFSHGYLSYDEMKAMRLHSEDKEDFAAKLDRRLSYCFRSRSECEVLIGGIHNNDAEQKIDIYRQVLLNFTLLLDYVWSNV